jgi:hypothetical protein
MLSEKKKKKERRGMKDLAWSKFNSTDVLWTKNRSLSFLNEVDALCSCDFCES